MHKLNGKPVQSAAPPAGRPKRYVDPVRAQWRRDLQAARDALIDRPQREARLLARVEQWLAGVEVERLGFFWPTRAEPDLAALVGRWLHGRPSRRASLPVIGVDSSMSSALPAGMPSKMSVTTTSAKPLSTMRCAVVEPTNPPPTTVTFFRIRNSPE